MIHREITIEADEVADAIARMTCADRADTLAQFAEAIDTMGSSALPDLAQHIGEWAEEGPHEALIRLARLIVAEVDSCCEHMGYSFSESERAALPRAERGQVHLDPLPFDASVGRGDVVELGCWDPAEALEYAAALTKAAHEASAQREEMLTGGRS